MSDRNSFAHVLNAFPFMIRVRHLVIDEVCWLLYPGQGHPRTRLGYTGLLTLGTISFYTQHVLNVQVILTS